MSSSQIPRDTFWIYQFIEKFSHFFIKIKFEETPSSINSINFDLKLKVEGFKGFIFYIYKSEIDKLKFDLINNPTNQMHKISNLNFIPKDISARVLDFFIIPFGLFNNDNQISLIFSSPDFQIKFQFLVWTPSYLFKNIKSIIKINNQYVELKPIYEGYNNFYQVENWFKANESGSIFQMINLLTEVDEFCGIDNIKNLISRTNDLVFSKSEPEDQVLNIINDLRNLKKKVIDISKEEIINTIENIINYYSDRE